MIKSGLFRSASLGILCFAFVLAGGADGHAQNRDLTPPPAPIPPAGGPCDIGNNPAATLLVPYFSVGLEPGGDDTQVVLVNTSDRPLVARVVVWNVDAWAVMGFNIWLYKHDVVPFSLRWLLVDGFFPNNGCPSPDFRFTLAYADCDGDGQYFDNAWSADDGLFSAAGFPFDTACYARAAPGALADWQCKLSIGSYDGPTDNLVGYLTVDTTITCAGGIPDTNPGPYFKTNYLDTDGDGTPDHGVMENTNALMGDIYYLTPSAGTMDGIPAVHIEALGEANSLQGHTWGITPDRFIAWGVHTFWSKYEMDGYDPATLIPNDCRESLPLWWGFRYIVNAEFDGGTWVDAWRSHNPAFDHWYIRDGPCAWEGIGEIYTTLYDYFDGILSLPWPGLVIYDEEENTASGFF
jgi:hypothetical protein